MGEGTQRKRVFEKRNPSEPGIGFIVPLEKISDDDVSKAEKKKGRRRFGVSGAKAARRPLVLVVAAMVATAFCASRLRPEPSSPPLRRRRASMGTVVYGTAWKGPDTARLVSEAVRAGFRHVATAARHGKYNETGVGEGWTAAAAAEAETGRRLTREDLFLQTMFVPSGSADYLPPGVAKAPNAEEEVRSAVRSSLVNLRTDYIDAVLYYNVKNKLDPIEQLLAAWRVLEAYVDDGTIRYLGVANCHDLGYLRKFYDQVRVKPSIVQNRFHANRQFGAPLRPFLRDKNITWQTFWTLTGNGVALRKDETKELAEARGLTPQTFMYAFVLSLGGTSPMIGTTSREHMESDLAVARKFEDGGAGAFFDKDEDRRKFAAVLGKPDLV